MRLVLASSSPRRAELLTAAGYTFEVLTVPVDETVRIGESPHDHVRRLAAEKSAAAWEVCGRRKPENAQPVEPLVVMGADTVVVADGEMLGKPNDDEDARAMLRQLSGRDHLVVTGVSIRTSYEEAGGVDETRVWFRPLAAGEIAWYVKTGEGRDKAGAYAIQGRASRFVPRIDGSYSNVVGLPLALVDHLIGRAVASRG